jgi:malonyl CoA-acyl carrier protein transacylase
MPFITTAFIDLILPFRRRTEPPLRVRTVLRYPTVLAHEVAFVAAGLVEVNTGGRAVSAAEAILDDLAQAVAQPVQWYDAMRLLPELGATCAIDTPPGHVLTRLLAPPAPTVTALSVDDDGIRAVTARAIRRS